jgi:DNA-binding NtrC family response regulator
MPHAQSTAAELASLLNDSLAPVYVLDDDRRIVFCNRACAHWIGVTPAELLDQQCVYTSQTADGSPPGIAAGLCPPPRVFAGEPQTAVVCCTAPDGRTIHRRGRFLPLSDGADQSAAVVAVLESSDCSPTSAETADHADQDTPARLHEQLRAFRRRMVQRYPVDRLLGDSPTTRRARAQIELAAQNRANVLIVGPDGTGKDHVAKAIHYAQHDPGPLVPVACDVLEVNLLRAELRAIRSPAVASQQGRATLLLNDVDWMPAEGQSDVVELLGDSQPVRVVATASRPLGEVGQGDGFSPMLACALSTITIELAPLCERLQDLPVLVQAQLEDVNLNSTKQVGAITNEALDRLAAYPWPGNLDELATVIREAHERAAGAEVTANDLPKQIQWAAESGAHPPRTDPPIVLEEFLAGIEKEIVARAMRRAKNNKSKAAKLLGLTRPRLYRRLVQLGLEQPDNDQQA